MISRCVQDIVGVAKQLRQLVVCLEYGRLIVPFCPRGEAFVEI